MLFSTSAYFCSTILRLTFRLGVTSPRDVGQRLIEPYGRGVRLTPA
jgi:hypothetical protein